MTFPPVTLADWHAQVEKDLAGASFEKALVRHTPEGLALLPLYAELPASGPLAVDCSGAPFRICMRHGPDASEEALREDLDGGADALWLGGTPNATADDPRLGNVLGRPDRPDPFLLLDVGAAPPAAVLERLATRSPRTPRTLAFALAADPCGALARGEVTVADLPARIAALVEGARLAHAKLPGSSVALASALPYADAGADAADEIAFVLATGVAYLGALVRGGLTPESAGRQIALQVTVGRDTFLETCKLRALRACWQKVLVATGTPGTRTRTLVHAVCASRTLTQRDPSVNLLRVTTQVFAAVLGGADLVTPAAFDQALGSPSALGRRVARNTGLVLREESYLGRVVDPVGGSYYFETVTLALAREAWKRFQAVERDGGIADAIASGRVAARLESAWKAQLDQISKRRSPIVGVSEFANLDETLPVATGGGPARAPAPGLRAHRDAEVFERLRDHADSMRPAPVASLVALGPLPESRPRVGFAQGFFAAGGIRASEATGDAPAVLACLCGSDERYASEAVARARSLKANGVQHLYLAGRPGALETALRDAGVDGFLFVGCDVAATLSDLQGVLDVPA